MKEKLKQLTPYYGLFDYWKEKVQDLKHLDDNFDVLDLDDTLFATIDRRESDEIFQINRGKQGNLLIVNELGLQEVINKYYKNKLYPKNIISKVNKNNSLILTAGIREYQEEKIEKMGIHNFNMLVTNNAEEKIIALIRYVIFDLKYIPKTITVYEDRPEFFLEYRDLLEDILGTKIVINKVIMSCNNKEPEIIRL
ncbi:MAG: hypothetical protein GY828_04700 [Candidatus Gracilibacteria bacterium]|nr:hypothetical protein [Candidatus Gracilibacteria bacterium]